jgi:hypothetical protein
VVRKNSVQCADNITYYFFITTWMRTQPRSHGKAFDDPSPRNLRITSSEQCVAQLFLPCAWSESELPYFSKADDWVASERGTSRESNDHEKSMLLRYLEYLPLPRRVGTSRSLREWPTNFDAAGLLDVTARKIIALYVQLQYDRLLPAS